MSKCSTDNHVSTVFSLFPHFLLVDVHLSFVLWTASFLLCRGCALGATQRNATQGFLSVGYKVTTHPVNPTVSCFDICKRALQPKASIFMFAGGNATAKRLTLKLLRKVKAGHTHLPVSPHKEGNEMKNRLGKKERRKRNVNRNMIENEGNVCK